MRAITNSLSMPERTDGDAFRFTVSQGTLISESLRKTCLLIRRALHCHALN